MTLGSLFDGSGGFPLAGTLSNITPVWAAEIEPYPIAVTRSRFPTMQHRGNSKGTQKKLNTCITAGRHLKAAHSGKEKT